jgi:ABC-2 type transport system ATP-binding protein
MPAIDIQGLRKVYGETVALEGIDLQVEQGEIFGLVGPDGAGKTSLIRLLCGILTPTGGTATVFGDDIVRDPEAVKRHLGYMSQRFSLYADLTVEENMRFFEELYRVPKGERAERRRRLLEFSRLGPFIKRRAGKLSGGMKQKLGLSCTLIHTPKILFLDEPTTGVDPISRRELWGLLYDLWHDGMTILISTPYMDEAERCNRLAFIRSGRIIALGTPDEIKSGYPYEIAEVVTPRARELAVELESREDVAAVHLYGDRLHVSTRDYGSSIAALSALFEKYGVGLDSIRKVSPTLESVFLHESENSQ